MFTADDEYLFHQGTNYRLYKGLGAHPCTGPKPGTLFSLWAPHAKAVSVITDKTGWDRKPFHMKKVRDELWERFIPNISPGTAYRYIITAADGSLLYKSDPMALQSELRPATASVVAPDTSFPWTDEDYIRANPRETVLTRPMAIYEVHLGSWKKDYSLNKDGFINYRELALRLGEYVTYMGYTHVELMGISEYPFDGSWGYQVTGFFSPTSRHGSPDDLRFLINHLHSLGIGVILDWVPAHFPKDAFGLSLFDGEPLYESGDPLRAEYPQWGTKAFDHGRPEVRSFLISSACYWIDEFHVDGLRVDAVAAMLFNSFGRQEWRPNSLGGPENLESTAFLRQLNCAVGEFTRGWLIAEDSSIVKDVTETVAKGGIGFLLKWNLGWMNDTLKYLSCDPVYRKGCHSELVHISDYAFTENFVLVLSHDEVVHLKHPMLEKFPGPLQDRLGCLKSLYTYQFTLPGKKLLFMGQDFGEDREWDENREINWSLAENPGRRDVMLCLKRLLELYRSCPVLHSDSKDTRSFEWIKSDDSDRNIVSFVRRNPWDYNGALLIVCNFSPVAYPDYSCGAPVDGIYRRLFSSYDYLPGEAGGLPQVESVKEICDTRYHALHYGLRPYESVIFSFP